MDAGEATAAHAEQAPVSRQTVVALFEDTIDAERALVALRKADHDAERVSLLVRDKNADEESGADRAGAVARAVVATALDAVGGWLQGLASLIVPERGTFLVAGPIGAALAGKRDGSSETVIAATAVATSASDLAGGGLLRTLGDFGFSAEEATYLEHRLAAGVALVAVTANDEAASQATRRLFADHDAVYIGTARTDSRLLAEAEALLGAPPEVAAGGDVVVTDAVARLRRVGEQGGSARSKALCERPVVDEAGEELGRIEEVLVESVDATGPTGPEPEREVVRYVVVGFGGVLGLGRRHVAVPAPLLDLDAHPIRLRTDKKVLQRAPAYDEGAPFSRREERAVSAYFGTPPYWQEA
jgi:hypothetical protein